MQLNTPHPTTTCGEAPPGCSASSGCTHCNASSGGEATAGLAGSARPYAQHDTVCVVCQHTMLASAAAGLPLLQVGRRALHCPVLPGTSQRGSVASSCAWVMALLAAAARCAAAAAAFIWLLAHAAASCPGRPAGPAAASRSRNEHNVLAMNWPFWVYATWTCGGFWHLRSLPDPFASVISRHYDAVCDALRLMPLPKPLSCPPGYR